VIEAADQFKADAHEPLADPRSRLLVEDAGTYLRSTRVKYDVVISEPSNLWIAGMADLFTRDFYRVVASKLTPRGIFCQWVQCYQTSGTTLETVLRTLATRFPHGQLFFVDATGDLIILASPEHEVPIDLDRLGAAFDREQVAADLARVGVESRGSAPGLPRQAGERGGDHPEGRSHRRQRLAGAPCALRPSLGRGIRVPVGLVAPVANDLALSIDSDPVRAAALLDEASARASGGQRGGIRGIADGQRARRGEATLAAVPGERLEFEGIHLNRVAPRRGCLARQAALLGVDDSGAKRLVEQRVTLEVPQLPCPGRVLDLLLHSRGSHDLRVRRLEPPHASVPGRRHEDVRGQVLPRLTVA
jgi:hypothetical protein